MKHHVGYRRHRGHADGDGQLVQFEASSGHCYRVMPRTKHRMQAIEDTVIFEVSTPELEDVVRFEDDYGRA